VHPRSDFSSETPPAYFAFDLQIHWKMPLAFLLGSLWWIDAAIDDKGRLQRDTILKELQEIYLEAPDASSKAYSMAQAALKIKEEMSFTDDEMDQLLPKPLRKGGK